MSAMAPDNTLLGKGTTYIESYDVGLLQPISRNLGRDAIGAHEFNGWDIWRLYEVTWIDQNGLPQVAAGEIHVPATSPNIVESKSLKLYIGSFTQSVFRDIDAVNNIIERDVSACVGAPVRVKLEPLTRWAMPVTRMPGRLLEAHDADGLKPEHYDVTPELLRLADGDEVVEETLTSDLLRSRCPVTGQPDHASVMIHYKGRAVNRQALLAYIVSYRRHQGFHEQCVEQIYTDIMRCLKPQALTVYACFTRRGGIDISPWRSNEADEPVIIRTPRQ